MNAAPGPDNPGTNPASAHGGEVLPTVAHTPPARRGTFRSAEDLLIASQLPAPAASLIRTVVRRSRLWKREQADIARELIAHFTDGLEAGRTADQLVSDFGNANEAAKLIRRGKKRNRHWLWHVQRRAWQALGMLILALAVFYAWFAVGTPTLSHNYFAEMNAPINKIPETERAWPLYREGLLSLPVPSEAIQKSVAKVPYATFPEDVWPGDELWPALIDYLSDAKQSRDLFIRGSRRLHLGEPLAQGSDPNPDVTDHINAVYGRAIEHRTSTAKAIENPPLYTVLFPSLGHVRMIARFLAVDAREAAEHEDGVRVSEDLRAMLALGEQTRENPFLIGNLVTIAIFGLQNQTLLGLLERYPGLFDAGTLTELAYDISGWHGGRLSINDALNAERTSFLDFLQRIYTDDNREDGRITPGGVLYLQTIGGFTSDPGLGESHASSVVGMVASPLLVASRQQQLSMYDQILALSRQAELVPPWEFAGDRDFINSTAALDHGLNSLRFAPVRMFIPAIDKARQAVQQAEYTRQATLAALAIHVYKLQTGSWPTSLDQLVPHYLPAIPIDMFDGKPLKYRVIDGRPFLYSIGSNRVDDGGAPTGFSQFAGRWFSPAMVEANRNTAHSAIPPGDWIFFPPSRAHEPDPSLKPAQSRQ